MSLHEVSRYWNHWRRMPPLRALVAACASALGVKIENPDDKPKPMTGEEAQRLMELTGGRIPGMTSGGA